MIIGEIRKGQDIGKHRGNKYIWLACEDCGKERWVQLDKGEGTHRCSGCSSRKNRRDANLPGEKAFAWKGGKWSDKRGYTWVIIRPGDFYYGMAEKRGYILEHRLVMAKSLNRCLLPWEVVHHKNGKKGDNGLENLELLPTMKYHIVDMNIKRKLKELTQQIAKLEMENKYLRAKLNFEQNISAENTG